MQRLFTDVANKNDKHDTVLIHLPNTLRHRRSPKARALYTRPSNKRGDTIRQPTSSSLTTTHPSRS